MTPAMEKSVSGSGWRSIARTVGRYLSCFVTFWNVPEGWIFALCICYTLVSSCLFQKRESNNFKGMSCLPDCDFLCAAAIWTFTRPGEICGGIQDKVDWSRLSFPFLIFDSSSSGDPVAREKQQHSSQWKENVSKFHRPLHFKSDGRKLYESLRPKNVCWGWGVKCLWCSWKAEKWDTEVMTVTARLL